MVSSEGEGVRFLDYDGVSGFHIAFPAPSSSNAVVVIQMCLSYMLHILLVHRSDGLRGARESGQAARATAGSTEDLCSSTSAQQALHVSPYADENHRPTGNQYQR